MASGDEAEKIRIEDDNQEDTLSQSDHQSPGGAEAIVCQTLAITVYPTNAASFFGVKRASVFGDPVEGGQGSLTAVGKTFFALNIGSAVPPIGAKLLCTFIDNRWIFRYDG